VGLLEYIGKVYLMGLHVISCYVIQDSLTSIGKILWLCLFQLWYP